MDMPRTNVPAQSSEAEVVMCRCGKASHRGNLVHAYDIEQHHPSSRGKLVDSPDIKRIKYELCSFCNRVVFADGRFFGTRRHATSDELPIPPEGILPENRIAERIRKFRTLKGLTQIRLAELSDIPQSGISDIETRRITPTVPTLSKIARALEVHIRELF